MIVLNVRISISTYILTSIVTYLPYMHPLCKILNTPVMSNKMSERGLKNINVFYSTFSNVFLFLSRFYVF